ncbi:Low affinity potassium transport system protein [Quillaja saponaria]|uniref:Low affinity potassium transport system protein n=1 Tax=Quillaja saponaria TaxID=32244 RepID=A0AAD7Q3B2_QUISA|nr:Low affinity potassium transport system protein [Quillaja saponaria]
MLLAVEGGGFFSSSASGYSKGLTVLLLGQKNEEKHMRVSPWNQYQLVNQESDPELQLASTKNRLAHGCASFVCFGRASAGLDSPSPLKVGPAQQQDILPGPLVSDSGKDPSVHLDDDNNNTRKVALKSSLKKRPANLPVPVEVPREHEPLSGKVNDSSGETERRKVQWTDACGSELAEIREFEASEVDGSDDEFDNGNERTCSCSIM